jgi:hypothetical protein
MADGLNSNGDAGDDSDSGQCRHEPEPPEVLSRKIAPS